MIRTCKASIIICVSVLCFASISLVHAQLDDPTLPPTFSKAIAEQESGSKVWILSSVLISSQRRVAIVNGQTVAVGDILDGARIKSIDSKGVKLVHEDEVVELTLHAVAVKKIRKEAQN